MWWRPSGKAVVPLFHCFLPKVRGGGKGGQENKHEPDQRETHETRRRVDEVTLQLMDTHDDDNYSRGYAKPHTSDPNNGRKTNETTITAL